MTLKDFIPPILIKLIKSPHKVYKSYESALKNCSNEGYQNIELCNMIADKTLLCKKNISNSINPTNVFLLAALKHVVNVSFLKNISVVDFGGACGMHYFEMKNYFSKSFPMKWYVIETKQMVISAKSRKLENDELTFMDSLDNLNNIDIVFSSGALQYTPDPYNYLQKIIQIDASYILFNRMMFNQNNRDIITIQKCPLSINGVGSLPEGYVNKKISYPHTTLSYKKFDELLTKKYQLAWNFEESTGVHQINMENIIGRGIFYKKNDTF